MNIVSVLVPVLTGIIGSYLTYYFTSKSKREEAITKSKEEKYSNLLIRLQGFIGSTTNAETKKEFFAEQYKSWLYCSDEVVEAINHMVSLVINGHSPKEGQKAVGNIVLAMRKRPSWKDKSKS